MPCARGRRNPRSTLDEVRGKRSCHNESSTLAAEDLVLLTDDGAAACALDALGMQLLTINLDKVLLDNLTDISAPNIGW